MMNLDRLVMEAIPLIAEDLKEFRVRLGMTSVSAAKRAHVDVFRYSAFENGKVHNTTHNLGQMISVAQRLGMDSVRMSYVDEIDQYMRVDVRQGTTSTIFIDTLDSTVGELKEQGHFLSPYLFLATVNQAGVASILDSRKQIDKMLVELWVTAILTTCLPGDLDYYVRPASADPPDTELAQVDHGTNSITVRMVEITQHSRYSNSLFDIIEKKLRKRYQEGTVLVVLVEEAQELPVAELYAFVQKNNTHKYQIFIIGGSGEAGGFRIVPWNEVTLPTPDDLSWMEISVDTKYERRRRSKYDGVIFKPPYTSRIQPLSPVFIRSVDLRR